MGRLLDYLDEAGLAQNTIVIYTSDQGFFLGDHGWYDKRFIYDHSVRMPFLMRYPAEVPGGTVRGEMFTNLDFAPTLLDYADTPVPAEMQGVSGRALLRGAPPPDWQQSFYYRYWDHGGHNVCAHYGVRTLTHKLIYFHPPDVTWDGRVCAEPRVSPYWELFDLVNDPNELRNVYGVPAYTSVQAQLHCELERLQRKYGDEPLHNIHDGYDYFKMREGLDNCRIKFELEKKARVVFMGGSITEMGTWCNIVEEDLKKRFPQTEFDFINAGVGSMGSTPHSFRFVRDALANGPVDLLFIEAAVNDEVNGQTPVEMLRGMEGVVRQARIANANMDIVMLQFVDPDKMKVINNGKVPVVVQCHEKVAEYYGVPSIDLAKEITERIRAGEFTWEDDFKDLHPSPFGHALYGRSIKRLFDEAWKQPLPEGAALKPCKLPEKPLDQKSYFRGKLVDLKKATLGDGWVIVPNWKPDGEIGTRKGFVNVPALVSAKPGSTLTLVFEGTAVGIFVAAGPDAGTVQYSIDGGPFTTRNLYTTWSGWLHLPWAQVLNADLAPGQHELVLKVTDKSDSRSKGTAVRIMHFLVN